MSKTIQSTLSILREKFPLFVLTIHTTITVHLFQPCTNTNEQKLYFWIYYPILCLFCFIWEIMHGWVNYTTKYPHGKNKDHIFYTILTGFIGVWSFIVTSYYVNLGLPFKCLFNYDTNLATIIFYSSTLIITLISYTEHLHWQKLVKNDFSILELKISDE